MGKKNIIIFGLKPNFPGISIKPVFSPGWRHCRSANCLLVTAASALMIRDSQKIGRFYGFSGRPERWKIWFLLAAKNAGFIFPEPAAASFSRPRLCAKMIYTRYKEAQPQKNFAKFGGKKLTINLNFIGLISADFAFGCERNLKKFGEWPRDYLINILWDSQL